MNVKNNVITYVTPKKIDTPKQSIKKEEFKKVLDNHELSAKNSSRENVNKNDNQDQNLEKSSNENLNKVDSGKVKNEKQSNEVYKTKVEGTTEKDLDKLDDTSELDVQIINLIQASIDALKQNNEKLPEVLVSTDKSTEGMEQIQQLLQLLSSMFQSRDKTPVTSNSQSNPNAITFEKAMSTEQFMGTKQLLSVEQLTGTKQLLGVEQLIDTKQLLGEEQLLSVQKLTPETKGMLKNNLSEIVGLLENSKGNNEMKSQILDVLQKLASQVEGVKEDLSLLKVPSFQAVSENIDEISIKGKSIKDISIKDKSINDNLIKMVRSQSTKTGSEILTKNPMQSSSDNSKGNKSSGNNSFEDKFLKNLMGEDKDEMKISKAVNFMNQFETVKGLDTAKVQTPTLVINKNNFGEDVIKSIKFMQINNIKDLIVKMNPKELGEITIKLTMESGILKANISAQNKDTYNLLNTNFQDISDKLKAMDIKIQSLDINIYEDSTFFNKDSNQKNSNERQNNNREINMGLEDEDISISNNYAIEENQVNKFV